MNSVVKTERVVGAPLELPNGAKLVGERGQDVRARAPAAGSRVSPTRGNFMERGEPQSGQWNRGALSFGDFSLGKQRKATRQQAKQKLQYSEELSGV